MVRTDPMHFIFTHPREKKVNVLDFLTVYLFSTETVESGYKYHQSIGTYIIHLVAVTVSMSTPHLTGFQENK